jgi:hypothetical protein
MCIRSLERCQLRADFEDELIVAMGFNLTQMFDEFDNLVPAETPRQLTGEEVFPKLFE